MKYSMSTSRTIERQETCVVFEQEDTGLVVAGLITKMGGEGVWYLSAELCEQHSIPFTRRYTNPMDFIHDLNWEEEQHPAE